MKRARLGAWAFFAPPVLVVLFFLLAAFSAQAQITWAYRSNATEAYHADGFKVMKRVKSSSAIPLTSTAISGVFGGQYLDATGAPQIQAPGLHNTPIGTTAVTFLFRLVPVNSGAPAARKALFSTGSAAGRTDGWYNSFAFNITTAGRLQWGGGTFASGCNFACEGEFTTALTFVANQPTDIWFRWTGNAADDAELWQAQNGATATLVATYDVPASRSAPTFGEVLDIQLNGNAPSGTNYNDAFHINEVVIWDSYEDPSSFGARADWIPTTSFEGYSYTDPGAANVLSTASYTFAGSSITGTYNPGALFSDLSEDEVLEGTSWAYNSLTNNRTGTYVPPDTADVKESVLFGFQGAEEGELLCTDPGEANVSDGVEYTIYSDEYVGTRETVTNVMRETSLRGQSLRGTLRAQ